MTGEELKDALIKGYPIIYKNAVGYEAEYKCVKAIIYRAVYRGVYFHRVKVEVEILHENGYVVTCDPAQIRCKGADDL